MAEARQLDDARASLRLSRSDLIRLALDDLYRGPRFSRRSTETVSAVAA